MQTVRNDIKIVEDIALRISMDTKSIRDRLSEIESKPEKERTDTIREINQNFGLLVEHMANQLNKTALKLNPKKASDTTSIQKSPNKKAKKSPRSSSSTEDEETDSGESTSHRRSSRKMKRRRKLTRSRANASSSASSNSEDLPNRNIKDEPFVISQDLEDLMNGTSNSANESLTKENDLLGFDHVNDMEIGIKTGAMLNSDPTILSPNAAKSSNKCPNQSSTDLTAGKNSTPNESNDKVMDVSTNSALEPMNEESAALSSNDIIDNDDDDEDDEDEEIARLLDFKSIENRRTASTNAEAKNNADTKINGIVQQSAKKAIKKPEKEDELAKFLAKNSDDTEKTVESDEEKSERPEEKEKYTEEQYLKEQNEKLKEQLLQSSSESEENMDDSDDDGEDGARVNGNII